MSEFKVGDKVRVIEKNYCNPIEIGHVGTINEINPENYPYIIQLDNNDVSLKEDWCELVGKGRPARVLPIKYAVFYKENDVNPMATFTAEKELKSWLTNAKDNEEIDFSSIRVFEVKRELRVEAKTSFKLVG